MATPKITKNHNRATSPSVARFRFLVFLPSLWRRGTLYSKRGGVLILIHHPLPPPPQGGGEPKPSRILHFYSESDLILVKFRAFVVSEKITRRSSMSHHLTKTRTDKKSGGPGGKNCTTKPPRGRSQKKAAAKVAGNQH
jgi:hypothetical protein